MLEEEFHKLLKNISLRHCEEQTLEIKSAAGGCPERLYDSYSSFGNQNSGGVLVFGMDETRNFKITGVYDAQDLQKKLVEVGEAMTPRIDPVLSVFEIEGKLLVTAEIPPVDLSMRPCFKTSRGRLKGSFTRIGDADMPMTGYEIYSYEAYRKRIHDDRRPVPGVSLSLLDSLKLEDYLLKRRMHRPNLSSLPAEQLYELTGITSQSMPTLSSVLLFTPYPQGFFPQLSIIAARIPGTAAGTVNDLGQRFTDSRRIEGTLPEMLETALQFVRSNMRVSMRIHPKTGQREEIPEYPLDAVREAILNALVHRDYSIHTENMPIQLVMYADRMEVISPGGLYGCLSVDDLGNMQPDTRNVFLVTMMEALGLTENRYSGIPRIRTAADELGLPPPVFLSRNGAFTVCIYNHQHTDSQTDSAPIHQEPSSDKQQKSLLDFCRRPRNRGEIADFLGIASQQYAIRRYVEPLIQAGLLLLSRPDHPRSSRQTYVSA